LWHKSLGEKIRKSIYLGTVIALLFMEYNSCLFSEEISCLLWNSDVNYHVHNSPLLAPCLGLNPVHILILYGETNCINLSENVVGIEITGVMKFPIFFSILMEEGGRRVGYLQILTGIEHIVSSHHPTVSCIQSEMVFASNICSSSHFLL